MTIGQDSAPRELALSTCYFIGREVEPSGETIAREARNLGFRGLELEYRLTEAQLKGLAPFLARGDVSAVSVHHPLPLKPGVRAAEVLGRAPKFSSLDPDERRAAVRACAETLSRAADLGADVVVLHLGQAAVDADLDPPKLERLFRAGKKESPAFSELRELVAAARRAAIARHRDAVLLCLDDLAGRALKVGAMLGLENRYHPVEIPDRDDLEVIFRELRGAPIGYWHDTGHGASLEGLGFLGSQRDLLTAFGDRLLGIHLHDARGIDDHLPPGEGELDFRALAPLVRPEARFVLEVQPPASPESIAKARETLWQAGFPLATPHPGIA